MYPDPNPPNTLVWFRIDWFSDAHSFELIVVDRQVSVFRRYNPDLSNERKKKKKQQNQVTFQIGASEIAIQCAFSQRGYDKLGAPRRMNLQKYKRVSLHEILPL